MADAPATVHDRFLGVAERYADRAALAFRAGDAWERWTYRALADRASAVAALLRASGIRPGNAVGIVASRHPDTVAAMIAALEAGAHYVPLDPAYPAARLRLLVEDAKVGLALSAVALPAPDRFPAPVRVLDALAPAPRATGAEAGRASGEDAAYVMFTSGSTGEPKGVVVPHRAILRLVERPNFMRLDENRVFLGLAPMGFDASTLEIWGPLLNGGCCALYPDSMLPTSAGLKEVIRAARVNALWLTASLFNSVVDQDVDSLAGVEELLTGGEALSVPHVARALSALRGTQLINGYGPTENTTFTACYRIPPDFPASEARVPIGVPITGTEVRIVDENLQPVADGAEGELVALGRGLALGYLNRPELTRERFVRVARGADGGLVAGYRTGDRVVRRPDGLIDYLGRFDDQVKIEGHRIEPGEIERAIRGQRGVADCRILVRVGPQGQKRIAAYVVADESARAGLKPRLAETLPAYLLPHYLFYLDALPVNANGKLDKDALPDPFAAPAAAASDAPSPELASVWAAWQEILERRPASEDVNFFDAGGTSLEAVRLFERLAQRSGRDLAPTFVFEHPTIRRQAAALAAPSPAHDRDGGRGRLRRNAVAGGARGRGR